MKTPIVDFLHAYEDKKAVRMHMPGHKGQSILGFEGMDLTEIDGADELFEANGIIFESEKNASKLFGCSTYYSTQGSTLCIQTMCTMLKMDAQKKGKPCKILAGRNAHRSFIHAAALLDLDVAWLYGKNDYLSCQITAQDLEEEFQKDSYTALYLTNPDYLGNVVDIHALASICHKYDVLLAVDNAHGAYLRFLEKSLHPIDLGADLCCDSAHKTLPVLTGGAYLHLSASMQEKWGTRIKHFMELFSSTSPSYLILASLDACNKVLDTTFSKDLKECIDCINHVKNKLRKHGFRVCYGEALKISIATKLFGYTGQEIASYLMRHDIYPEFYDEDYIVLMPSPYNTKEDFVRLESCLCALKKKEAIKTDFPEVIPPKKICSIRKAYFSPSKKIDISNTLGHICSNVSVSCPPAILPVIPGEKINASMIQILKYYHISSIEVIE